MTRQVFDNQQTAHVWANGNLDSGRSNNGNFYFTGRRLYSYGSHFVAGIRLPGVGPVLNRDRYSISTAKHMGYANRATNYKAPDFPELTKAADWLERLALAYASTGETARRYRADNAGAVREARAYLERHAATLGDDAGALVLRLIGSRGTWEAFKARALAAAERKSVAAAKAHAASSKRDASRIAALPVAVVKARAMALDSYTIKGVITEYRFAHLNAGTPRIKAAVWARLKIMRAVAAKLERTHRERYSPAADARTKARQGIATLRRIQLRDWSAAGLTPGGRYPFGRVSACRLLEESSAAALRAHMPTATRERLARQLTIARAAGKRLEQRADARQARQRARDDLRRTVRELRQWRDTVRDGTGMATVAGESPDFATWIETGPPVQVVRSLSRMESALTAFAAAGRFPAMLERLNPLLLETLRPALERAEARLEADREAERERAARIAAMSPAERRAAWQAGEPGVRLQYGDSAGPALRAIGAEVDGCTVIAGELETSEGARVPLRHAFRVFQFVAACRAAGKGWQPGDTARKAAGHSMPGPRQIRVGHFNVDSISAAGDFAAGCHRIQWAEVIALAERLGVADCMAAPETISGELETAA